jgi:hypothetical protein
MHLILLSLSLLVPPALAQEEHSEFELDRVVPGATGADLRGAFGEPLQVERNAEINLWREDFALVAAGYAQVTAWYDTGGAMRCARVVPVNPLKPVAAGLLFDLRSGATRSDGHGFTEADNGHFLHHGREGIHFFLEEGRVREIWRTASGVLPADLARGLYADYPARALPERPVADEPGPVESAPDVDPPNPGIAGSLSMENTTVSIVFDSEYNPQLAITAVVFANGLRDEEIRFEGILCPFSGSMQGVPPLAASTEAPAELRDEGGFLHPVSIDTVLYDTSRFGTPTLIFPLRFLEDYDSNFSGHFQVSFEVSCGRLMAFDTAIATVPGPRVQNSGAPPTIAAGEIRVEEGGLEGVGSGLWVYRDIATTSAQGKIISTHLFLRHPDGRYVQAAAGWDDWRLDDGRFYSCAQDKALYDDSSWTDFRTFLPFDALDLKGGTQRLILRVQSSIGSLGGAHEREISIDISGGRR